MRAQPVNEDEKQPTARASGSGQAAGQHASCLYLGPQGERCARAALDDGFCELHEAQRPFPTWILWLRRAAGALLLLIILWVTLADFLREILSRLR